MTLGLTTLKGAGRRELRDQIAFHRAEFEWEYAGRRIAPFDREYVVGQIPQRYRDEYDRITVYVSAGFVEECQARVPYMRRLIEEHGA